VLWRAWHLRRQQRLNRPWRTRSIRLSQRGINWSALPLPARLVLRLLGPINQVDSLTVAERRLGVKGLHPDMNGYKVLFLTDFHVHKWMRGEWFQEVIRETLALRPDAVVLGGDFVSRRAYAEAAAEALAGLDGAPNLVAVRGNHDYWTRPHFFANMVKGWGGRILQNDVAVLRRGEGAVALVGVEAPYLPLTDRSRSELKRRLTELGLPRLGVVHTPQAYGEAADLGCSFVMAGHTHGGQVRLPFFGTTICSCPGKPEEVWGAGRRGRTETFTANGIGAFYPLRIACPPQAVLLTLEAL
jgi:predicted MPP superfamily phosphohydrolase